MNKPEDTTNVNNKSIESLEKTIDKLTELQDNLKDTHSQLILILKNYCSKINEYNTTKKYFSEIDKKLSEININICISLETISLNKKLLTNSKKLLLDFQQSRADNKEFKDYTIKKKEMLTTITQNSNTIKEFIENNKDIEPNILEESIPNTDANGTNPPTFLPLEKTLLISETKNKVILPYTLSELENYIRKSPEQNLSFEQVIDRFYTVSLDNYKNPVLSRFSETFKLVRNKEHGSLKDALDLSLEMAFNYNLHPAVITACNNINELDIYLACLEYNEMEDFKFFDIKFEVSPAISKKRDFLIQ